MTTVTLRQLQTFVTIAEAGGFASAQSRLSLSQPAASRQIQALEGELGVLLFDRVGRRIRLTSEGEDLLRRSRVLLQDVEALSERARALKSGRAGTLRVGASTQHIEAVLADFLPRYRQRHSSVDVTLIEDGGARLPERLERGDVHLALLPAGDGAFHRRLLAPLVVLAVVASDHPLADRDVVEVDELADEPLVVLGRDFASRGWFDAACALAHFRPRVVLESVAPHTVLALARAGQGIGVVPSNVRIAGAGTHALPLVRHGEAIGRWTSVAWDPRRFLASYAQQFAVELATYCRRHYPNRSIVESMRPLPRPKEDPFPVVS